MKCKFLIISVFLLLLFSCKVTKEMNTCQNSTHFDFKKEINQSILDGFFDNDSSKITPGTYFIK